MNQPGTSIVVDLVAQQSNKNIEVIAFDVASPDGPDQMAPFYNFPSTVHELFEQTVFRLSQPDPCPRPRDQPCGRIQDQIGYLDRTRLRNVRAPFYRPEPCQKLIKGKWLRHIVVGAQIQAVDYVLDRVFRGEHQEGGRYLFRTQALSDFIAAHPRHHDIQNDHVEVAVGRELQAGTPVRGALNRMTLLGEAFMEEFHHAFFIFDNQQLHRSRPGASIASASA